MRLKKSFQNITLYFEIKYDRTFLESDIILDDILKSLYGFKFINRGKPYNDLMKEQQKYNKHILVDFQIEPFMELKFMIKAIYNFLLETNQIDYFMIDEMHIETDNGVIIIYATECLRKHLGENATISPTIRACWGSNPSLVEHILKKPSSFL